MKKAKRSGTMKKHLIMKDLKIFLSKHFRNRTINIFSATDIIKNSINKRILEIAVVNNVNINSGMITDFIEEFDFDLKDIIISNLQIIKKIENRAIVDYVHFTETGINNLIESVEEFVFLIFEKFIAENEIDNFIS